jgi:hypothetical protein
MEILVKPEILMSCIYMDLLLATLKAIYFYVFAAQCFNIESMQKVFCVTVVCKQFASYQDCPNYKLVLIR